MIRIFKMLFFFEQRISGLERQIISLKYPEGFKIGSKAKAYGYGKEPKDVFIASKIYMKCSTPYIDIFCTELDPPSRSIPVESLVNTYRN